MNQPNYASQWDNNNHEFNAAAPEQVQPQAGYQHPGYPQAGSAYPHPAQQQMPGGMPAMPQQAVALMPQAGRAQVPTGTNRGPLGKERNVAVMILLSILTIGFYGLFWTYQTFAEMKRHRQTGIGGVAGLLISFVPFVEAFLMPSEIDGLYRGANRRSPVSASSGLWMLLPCVGWLVWLIKVQGALNEYWQTSINPTTQAAQQLGGQYPAGQYQQPVQY